MRMQKGFVRRWPQWRANANRPLQYAETGYSVRSCRIRIRMTCSHKVQRQPGNDSSSSGGRSSRVSTRPAQRTRLRALTGC